MTNTILQLLPADGWQAIYIQTDNSLRADPLVAWALMARESARVPSERSPYRRPPRPKGR